MPKIDRTGEINYNKYGSKMIIIKYRNANDIDVLFEEYGYIVEHTIFHNFKIGNIRCPYELSVYGVGYLGEGNYKTSENKKHTRSYNVWIDMIRRCYNPKCYEKYPTYKECFVCDEWHNYQNFAKWYEENYYEINNQRMHLDKDILHKGNKLYSKENCIFVPENINNLFVKCNSTRGDLPIGVTYDKRNEKYSARYDVNGKKIYLGLYNTPQEAFQAYKKFKENYIKQVADEYKEYIPQKLYEAMYNYEVEIGD